MFFEGGYYRLFRFYFNDHLGNVCAVAFKDYYDDVYTLQQNHYYPFGIQFAETDDFDQRVQPYLYNGKELDRNGELNLYDYGARYYDPAIARFTTIDPMAEKYYSMSPYAYCGNNPVNAIDPDGMDWYRNNEKDEYIWREGSEDIEGYNKIGSAISVQLGDDLYINYYQNAGIKANKAVNAFDLISQSPKLQGQLLGKNSVLSVGRMQPVGTL